MYSTGSTEATVAIRLDIYIRLYKSPLRQMRDEGKILDCEASAKSLAFVVGTYAKYLVLKCPII